MEETGKKKPVLGLLSFISLIVGIVFGAGIYFKLSQVTMNSGGNIWAVVLNFTIAAVGITFGGLAFSQLAIMSKGNGGIVAYFDEHISRKSATGVAWFQTFIYFPFLTALIAFFSAHLIFDVTGISKVFRSDANFGNISLLLKCLVGLLLIVCFISGNILSKKVSAGFQILAFITKLLPIIIVLFIGIIIASKPDLAHNDLVSIDTYSAYSQNPKQAEFIKSTMRHAALGAGFLGALPMVGLLFEGWMIPTTVVNDLRNRNRNIRLGYIIAPIIIFVAYMIFVLSTLKTVGSENVALSGTNSIDRVIRSIVGKNDNVVFGLSKTVQLIITISILGVFNGLISGGVRMPQALAEKGMIRDKSGSIAKEHNKYGLSIASGFIFALTTVVGMIIFYLVSILTKGIIDVGDLSVQFSYLFVIVLYIKMIQLTKKGKIKNKFIGYVCPVMGILISLLIFIGGFLVGGKDQKGLILGCIFGFGVLVLIVYLSGYFYMKKKEKLENIK